MRTGTCSIAVIGPAFNFNLYLRKRLPCCIVGSGSCREDIGEARDSRPGQFSVVVPACEYETFFGCFRQSAVNSFSGFAFQIGNRGAPIFLEDNVGGIGFPLGIVSGGACGHGFGEGGDCVAGEVGIGVPALEGIAFASCLRKRLTRKVLSGYAFNVGHLNADPLGGKSYTLVGAIGVPHDLLANLLRCNLRIDSNQSFAVVPTIEGVAIVVSRGVSLRSTNFGVKRLRSAS